MTDAEFRSAIKVLQRRVDALEAQMPLVFQMLTDIKADTSRLVQRQNFDSSLAQQKLRP